MSLCACTPSACELWPHIQPCQLCLLRLACGYSLMRLGEDNMYYATPILSLKKRTCIDWCIFPKCGNGNEACELFMPPVLSQWLVGKDCECIFQIDVHTVTLVKGSNLQTCKEETSLHAPQFGAVPYTSLKNSPHKTKLGLCINLRHLGQG